MIRRSSYGHRYIFGHFNSRAVGNGVRVSASQLIGYSGNTGNSTGPHLHFEIQVAGVRRCPQQLFLARYDGTSPPDPVPAGHASGSRALSLTGAVKAVRSWAIGTGRP